MNPALGVGPLALPAYLALLLTGFLAAAWYLRRQGERRGLDGPTLVDLAIVLLVAGVVGARLLAVLTDGKLDEFIDLCRAPTRLEAVDTATRLCAADAECGADYRCDPSARTAVGAGARRTMCYPPRDCLAVFKAWQGGLTFYGGLLLALPAGWWFARRRGLPVRTTADLAAPALLLGHAIGKIGCFLEGCCYGAPTTAAIGVRFPGHDTAVHPTQLYESAGSLVLFVVLHLLGRSRGRAEGTIAGAMLVAYGAWRLVLELLRDDPRGSLGWLSTSQVISIPVIVLGLAALIQARRTRRILDP